MVKIEEFAGQVEGGRAVSFRNLAVWPLVRKGWDGQPKYLLTGEAIGQGRLEVMEVDMMGHVPELLVRNRCKEMVLLLDGEELVGAKQNRIVNTTILLAAQSSTKIPVSCVERGRWRHISEHFTPGRHSPAALRAAKTKAVTRNLVATGTAHADQGEVWAQVSRYAVAANVHSPTDAMHEIFEKREDDLRSYADKFPYPKGASGCVVAIGGRFAAVDLFDKAETLAKVWERLLGGYILDAIVASNGRDAAFPEEMAEKLMAQVRDCQGREYPTVGLGKDLRFDDAGVCGSLLAYEGRAVHLCAFPNDGRTENDEGTPQGRIESPSRRRRHRGGGGTVY